ALRRAHGAQRQNQSQTEQRRDDDPSLQPVRLPLARAKMFPRRAAALFIGSPSPRTPLLFLLYGRKCKKRLPKEALPSYACVGGLLRRRHRHVERIRRTAGGELLLLRLLQTLPETGLHLLGGLLNESLLRGCDHAAD